MPRRPSPAAWVTALVVAVALASGACATPHRQPPGTVAGATDANGSTGAASDGAAEVARVVDGDTLTARIRGRIERVRLIGIDTPETKKPDTPVECFGKEASARLDQLVPPGTAVRLVRDAEARDRYGRLLAYVYRRNDGLFVNLTMAKEGFAAPLTVPPNVAHTDEFVTAAAEARRAHRGLWARCGSGHAPLSSGP